MKNSIAPFDAYKGKEPYIFISYAHRNSEIEIAIEKQNKTQVRDKIKIYDETSSGPIRTGISLSTLSGKGLTAIPLHEIKRVKILDKTPYLWGMKSMPVYLILLYNSFTQKNKLRKERLLWIYLNQRKKEHITNYANNVC
jgi:hypothetical protein